MLTIELHNTGKKATMPEGLHEVTLSKYIQFAQSVPKKMPSVLSQYIQAAQAYEEELQREIEHPGNKSRTREQIAAGISRTELDAAIDAKETPENRVAVLQYEAWCVSFWTGIEYDDLLEMQVTDVKTLYAMLMHRLTPQETEYTNVLQYKDELWYLPSEFMKSGTVIEYLEASEFEASAAKLAEGRWAVMPELMCILVKKEGEKYHKDLQMRKAMFMNWTMDKVWKVCFFLTTRIERSSVVFLTSTRALQVAQLKQVLNNLTSSTAGT